MVYSERYSLIADRIIRYKTELCTISLTSCYKWSYISYFNFIFRISESESLVASDLSDVQFNTLGKLVDDDDADDAHLDERDQLLNRIKQLEKLNSEKDQLILEKDQMNWNLTEENNSAFYFTTAFASSVHLKTSGCRLPRSVHLTRSGCRSPRSTHPCTSYS